jgi:ectoine hydroxylase-related dioxygenase (phytanoyl-CoA dioxygenase family)
MILNKKKYFDDGYLKIKNFIPNSIIFEIKEELSNIIMETAKSLSLNIKKNDFNYLIDDILPKIYKSSKDKGAYIFDVSTRLNIFRDLTNYNKTISVISKLLNLKKNQIISAKFSLFLFTKYHKKNSIGWHQESGYYSNPKENNFQYLKKNNSLFTWIPITDTWPGNGALVLMPKSHNEKNIFHNKNLFSKRYEVSPNKRGEIYIKNLNKIEKKYSKKEISSKSGDIIFVDSNTLHRSGENVTNKTRVGVIMRFGERF